MATPAKYNVKILILGETAVGKTSLLVRYTLNEFSENRNASLGVDFKIKQMTVAGEVLNLQIWDTAGKEQFAVMTSSFWRGASGVCIVFDVTDEASFKQCKNWLDAAQKEYEKGSVSVALVGTKIDLPNRVVTEDQGKQLAVLYGAKYKEVSSKTGQGVDTLFDALGTSIYERATGRSASPVGSPSPDKKKKKGFFGFGSKE